MACAFANRWPTMRFTAKTSLQTAHQHAFEVRPNGFDCVLPDSVRAELFRERPVKPTPLRSISNPSPRWLKSLLTFVAIIIMPVAMVAILVGIIAAFGGLKSRPSPEMQRIALAALDKAGRGEPAVQTPAVPPWSVVAVYCTTGRPPAIMQPTPAVEVRRATPAVMRGELVSLPVRRATLLRLPN